MGAEQSVHPLDPLPKTKQVGSRALVILPSAPSQTGSAPIMFFLGGGEWMYALPASCRTTFSENKLGTTKKKWRTAAHCAKRLQITSGKWKKNISRRWGGVCVRWAGGGVYFDRPVTVVALKRLSAGVFAVVPRQLVAPGESPLAAFPRALVRLLTCRRRRRRRRKERKN